MGKIPEEERRRTCWAKARVSACEYCLQAIEKVVALTGIESVWRGDGP